MFQTIGKSFGTSLPTSLEASASTFFPDATINGCGVGVGHEYLGFNRQYLAALIPNLNVFTVNLHFANMAKWGKYSGAHAPGWTQRFSMAIIM